TVSGLVVGWLVCCLRVVVVVVDVVGHTGVRGCGRGCWPWCGLSRWPWPVLVVCASLVFDVVGVVVGRGLCRGEGRCWSFMVSVERAFPVFDGVVYSLAEDWVVVLACSWSLPLSVGLAFRVVEDVGASAGRGLGRGAGRRVCRWGVPQECSVAWVSLLAEVWVAAWPVRAPCPGVTRPASPECASPQCWGLVCGGRCVACSWSPCGRGGCRWRGLCT